MQIQIPAAIGELIDKITILQIKAEKINDTEKLTHIHTELELLEQTRHTHVGDTSELTDLTAQLKTTNLALWEIEDDIRDCERQQDFGDKFIQLARSVYLQNDQRCDIKRQINTLTGSQIMEVKSYADYTATQQD